MRASRVIIVAVAGIALAVTAVLWVNREDSAKSAGLAARTVKVGAIDVRIEPHHIDATGALIKVTLDTHTTDLSMPLAATLRVGQTQWTGGTWSGDEPNGHHREGQFRFGANGAPAGRASFTLEGFGEPISASWEVGR